MLARIETAQARRGNADRQSSRELAAEAARACLEQAACSPDGVGLIIYSGTLRDEHVQEPASAPFLQQALGCNPTPGERYPEGTFSFDVSELLAAIEAAAGFVQSGRVERALVVAADGGLPDGSPNGIAPAAGALLLSQDAGRGFCDFRARNHPDLSNGFRRHVFWDGTKHVMRVQVSDDWLEQCVSAADQLVRTFLEERGPTSERMLVVPSQSPRGFPEMLEERLKLPCASAQSDGSEELYSAGPILALTDARDRFSSADQVLFVTVAPGMSVSLAMYDKRPGEAF